MSIGEAAVTGGAGAALVDQIPFAPDRINDVNLILAQAYRVASD